MKKNIIYLAALAVTAGAVVAGTVSAGWFGGGFGQMDPATMAERQAEMFNRQANLLGASEAEVKQWWAEGKNMRDMIEDLGLDQDEVRTKMQTNRQEQMRKQLQTLADQGIITQEQMDLRLENMANRVGPGGMFGGVGMKRGQRGMDGNCPCQAQVGQAGE